MLLVGNTCVKLEAALEGGGGRGQSASCNKEEWLETVS
jgi:hypothetical protein